MAYQVLTVDNRTVIEDKHADLQVQVIDGKVAIDIENTPYCLATLYLVKGGFMPEKVFIFQALKKTSLEMLKRSVDFFFSTLLETELYVKEVPPDSALFAEEAERIYGRNEVKADGRPVDVICLFQEDNAKQLPTV
jgi:hypothetical protein